MEPSPITTQMGEALLVRITRLERQIAMSKRINVILGVGLLATFALSSIALSASGAFSSDTTVEGEAFILRDAMGLERGRWGVAENGDVLLELKDQVPSPRLRFSVLSDGSPGISLKDGRGGNRAVLATLEGETSLAIADGDGNTRAVLGLQRNDAASLLFMGLGQDPRAGLGVDGLGVPIFMMAEMEGDDPGEPR
jgi:hypothetical protein